MIENVTKDVADIGIRLCDHAYLAWLSAETTCEQPLQAWFEGTRSSRVITYCAFRAASDREEAAARDLRWPRELTEPCCERLVRGEEGVLG
jgi:hypothetical protein